MKKAETRIGEYRVEVRFSSNTRRRLEKYRAHLQEKTGKFISQSAIVEQMVEIFLDRNEIEDS